MQNISIKPIQGKGRPSDLFSLLKILTPNQMLQTLPLAPPQVKTGSRSENLLNKIC